jgi:3-dehydroquinate synthase
MTQTVKVNIAATPTYSYDIKIDAGNLTFPKKWLPNNIKFNNIVIITDNTVKKLYLNALVDRLQALGHHPYCVSFPAGEKHKHQATKQKLEEKILSKKFGRDTLCIALGGGVVGDMSGFIAATYMRGIPYIQIPTTLLAMVDSSVGGKTAIDTPQGKNLIGAFWQPKAVVADINCLDTLTQDHFIGGLVEALKMFMTSDKNSFTYLQKNIDAVLKRDKTILKKIIQRAVTVKASVVAADEKESNMRMILNFGHTIGHALEKISNFKLLHGHAVAYGILLECAISKQLGLLDEKTYLVIKDSLGRLGFHADYFKKFNVTDIIRATQSDKKTSAGNVRYILLTKIGAVHQNNGAYAHTVNPDIIKNSFRQL